MIAPTRLARILRESVELVGIQGMRPKSAQGLAGVAGGWEQEVGAIPASTREVNCSPCASARLAKVCTDLANEASCSVNVATVGRTLGVWG